MANFFGGQVPLSIEEQHQQQQQQSHNNQGDRRHSLPHSQHSQLQQQQQAVYQGASGQPLSQQQQQQHRQHQSRLSMSSANLRSLGQDGSMQPLNYLNTGVDANSGVEDAFKNFSFSTADGSGFPGPMGMTTSEQNASISAAANASGFSPTSNMMQSRAESDPRSYNALQQDMLPQMPHNLPHGISQSLIDNVMSFQNLNPNMDLSQLSSEQANNIDAATLALLTTGQDSNGLNSTVMADLDAQFTTSPSDTIPTPAFVTGRELDMDGDNSNGNTPSYSGSTHTQRPAQRRQFSSPTSNSRQPSSPPSLTQTQLAVLQQQQQQGLYPSRPSTLVRRSTSSSAAATPGSTLRTNSNSASTALTPQISSISSMDGLPSTTPTTLKRLSTSGKGGIVAGPAPPPPGQLSNKNIKNYYSSSGFDMIKALYYVSSRPNPEIAIGPVDLSCAFVVCDATLEDTPIIYISDNFQHLTGYSSHEIIGQNCRFLQSPKGQVEAGSVREFTDNKAVKNIKEKLTAGREVQQSLINYRKGGTPFLNLLTMIPIPWDDHKGAFKYFIGLQIDLVESPDAVSDQMNDHTMRIDYKHRVSIPQYIWDPPNAGVWQNNNHSRTLDKDDISALLNQYGNKGLIGGMGVGNDIIGTETSNMYRQSWDKMLLENVDDVVHVLSLKGVFLYVSPSCKDILEYEPSELLGNTLATICHPSDLVATTREMRDIQQDQPISLVYRVRRKNHGYTWFEGHGSLLVEQQGKGRKCIVLVGRQRPAFALQRCDVDINGGIGDSEIWTKLSTSGMILHSSSHVRSLLDHQPDALVGTSIQELMRKDSRPGFNRALDKARRGIISSCKHEVQHRRGQVLQAITILYPGDAERGFRPTFVLAQTRLLKSSTSRGHSVTANAVASAHAAQAQAQAAQAAANAGALVAGALSTTGSFLNDSMIVGRAGALGQIAEADTVGGGYLSTAGSNPILPGSQDKLLASDDNIFSELKTTRCTSWQYELRQMEKANRLLAEELGQLLANRKKRKRRKGVGNVPRDCANCHTRNTPEWRRGPSGLRDLCNSCGLRWAKQIGRVSPRNSSRGGGTTVAGASVKTGQNGGGNGNGNGASGGGSGGGSRSGRSGVSKKSSASPGNKSSSGAGFSGSGNSGNSGSGNSGGGSGDDSSGGNSGPSQPEAQAQALPKKATAPSNKQGTLFQQLQQQPMMQQLQQLQQQQAHIIQQQQAKLMQQQQAAAAAAQQQQHPPSMGTEMTAIEEEML